MKSTIQESPISKRYEGIVNNLHEYSFHILGCGAIGSSAAVQLARSGAINFFLYDMDIVEDVNIGVSQYDIRHVGLPKVDALSQLLQDINPEVQIEVLDRYFCEYLYNGEKDIAILAFDNMDARLEAVEILCKTKQCPKLIIDGRMGAEHYQQYLFEKPTVKKYQETWYSNAEMASEPCNMKATTYCSYMSGSFIANSVRKYATKQPFNGNFSFNFPTMMLDKI
jgi:molybdopterin/thiamine biosynthesis adenylyltransferase